MSRPDHLRRDTWAERGAAVVEYALLVALIAVICLVVVQILGREASDTLSSVGSSLGPTGP